MKKIILILLALSICGISYAENFNTYQRASLDGVTVIMNRPGILSAINITSNDMTSLSKAGSIGAGKYITVYDNASAASGTVIAKLYPSQDTKAVVYEAIVKNGITVDNRSSCDMTFLYR